MIYIFAFLFLFIHFIHVYDCYSLTRALRIRYSTLWAWTPNNRKYVNIKSEMCNQLGNKLMVVTREPLLCPMIYAFRKKQKNHIGKISSDNIRLSAFARWHLNSFVSILNIWMRTSCYHRRKLFLWCRFNTHLKVLRVCDFMPKETREFGIFKSDTSFDCNQLLLRFFMFQSEKKILCHREIIKVANFIWIIRRPAGAGIDYWIWLKLLSIFFFESENAKNQFENEEKI